MTAPSSRFPRRAKGECPPQRDFYFGNSKRLFHNGTVQVKRSAGVPEQTKVGGGKPPLTAARTDPRGRAPIETEAGEAHRYARLPWRRAKRPLRRSGERSRTPEREREREAKRPLRRKVGQERRIDALPFLQRVTDGTIRPRPLPPARRPGCACARMRLLTTCLDLSQSPLWRTLRR